MTTKRYGVEIEVLIPNTISGIDLAARLTARNVPTFYAGYTHTRSGQWKLVTDGSLRSMPGFYGLELVSPPMSGPASFEALRRVNEVLSDIGARVNRSCGLHVHVDASAMNIDSMRRLAVMYGEAEAVIDQVMPPSRRGSNNQYCVSIARPDLRRRVANVASAQDLTHVLMNGSRYGKVNFASYWRHQTIEFRQHGGTFDHVKIVNWVKLCQRLVTFAETAEVSFTTGVAMPRHVRAGTKRALILELITRPGGASRAELQIAAGSEKLSIKALSRSAGVTIISVGRRNNLRYVVAGNAVTTQRTTSDDLPAMLTLDAMFDRLGCDADERDYWTSRRTYFNLGPAE